VNANAIATTTGLSLPIILFSRVWF
jgi:hypothetical protein